MPEVNYGQVVREVKRVTRGACTVRLLPKMGGEVHRPKEILDELIKLKEEVQ